MTQREITHTLVDIINYDYFWPTRDSRDPVYGFTHSYEVNEICAGLIPPFAITPVRKAELEEALSSYISRRGIDSEDAAKIRAWIAPMPDEIGIIERRAN